MKLFKPRRHEFFPRNVLRSRRQAGALMLDRLGPRRLFSTGSISTLAAFNGTDGDAPAALVGDSAGDLFGVTSYTLNGPDNGSGQLFKIAAGTSTIEDLATFVNPSGATDQGTSLIIDSSGNLFGTDSAGNNFEVPTGSTTPTTLVNFSSLGTGNFVGTVAAVDASGNLYGLNADGVFEYVHSTGTVSDGVFASGLGLQRLVLGPDGNLYGTNAQSVVRFDLTTGETKP